MTPGQAPEPAFQAALPPPLRGPADKQSLIDIEHAFQMLSFMVEGTSS